MDYDKIGQRIRKLRKECGLSQEALAEKVNISTTHMSHIETGNTKLSLPVLVDIANALQVRTDDLLKDSSGTISEDIAAVLARCDHRQAKVIADVVKATKAALDANP